MSDTSHSRSTTLGRGWVWRCEGRGDGWGGGKGVGNGWGGVKGGGWVGRCEGRGGGVKGGWGGVS